MGFGVLDTKEPNVPGTSLLTDDDPLAGLRAYGEDLDLSKLKYGTGNNSHIVLVPQPSGDPNDPLNWPAWKKWSCFFALVFGVTLTGVAGPLLSPATLVLVQEFNITLAEAGQATAGWQIFGVACSTPFWGPIIMKLGRRGPFVTGTILMAVGGIVTSKASSHSMLIAGRVILGVGMGPSECLAAAVVADLFFVHERGFPIAVLNLCFVNGINLSPSIAGLVTARHSWRTASWIFAGFAIAAAFVQLFFFMETFYIRKIEADITRTKSEDFKGPVISDATVVVGERTSYIKSLSLWSHVYPTQATFFQMLYRPVLLCFSPIIWFAFLGYGVPITFIVLVAVSASYIYSFPPYNFGPEQSGYVWFAPFVGTIIATLIVGKFSDLITKSFSHRNRGIYEPEFRLPLMSMLALVGGFGYLGYGVAIQHSAPWIASVVSFGLIGFGMTFGLATSSAYLVDSFGGASASALTSMMTLRNFVSFSATYWATPWIQSTTILSVFATIAGIHFAIGLLTIPMYIFGKKIRLFTSQHVHFQDDQAGAH